MNYATWAALVKQEGGTVTTIPSNVPDAFQSYVGYPAARYSGTMYATLANAGQIDATAPTVASNSNAYIYVVAPEDTWATAPHTMTTFERAENAVFSTGDAAADSLGLPSLDSINNFVKDLGKQILIGAGVAIGVAILLKRKR